MKHMTVTTGKRCQVVLKDGGRFVGKVMDQNDRAFFFEARGWVAKELMKSIRHYKPQGGKR